MQLVYFQSAPARVLERFSFFVIASDEDGVENLSELYLYHDGEGLRWRLTEKDWLVVNQGGHTWIGSRSIAMVDDGTLPRGQYRTVLVNKAGEQASRTFTFDPPAAPRYPFPAFTISDGTYRIASRYPGHFFIGYDEQGSFVQSIPISDLSGEVSALNLASNVMAIALWAEDAGYSTSALSDALPLK